MKTYSAQTSQASMMQKPNQKIRITTKVNASNVEEGPKGPLRKHGRIEGSKRIKTANEPSTYGI